MPRRPPKKWFEECVTSVSKDPNVTDPNAVCAWNWYYHMGIGRKREVLKGEMFDPELDLSPNTFAFDPKIRKRTRKIEKWIGEIKVSREEYKMLYRIFLEMEDFLEEFKDLPTMHRKDTYFIRRWNRLKRLVNQYKKMKK